MYSDGYCIAHYVNITGFNMFWIWETLICVHKQNTLISTQQIQCLHKHHYTLYTAACARGVVDMLQ